MPTDRSALVPPHRLRARFADAMSAMYRSEVPLYGELVGLVETVNREVIAEGGSRPFAAGRLEGERHGAIRLGTLAELGLVARAFAVLGLEPVGYYDLGPVGLPVHSTAFRPIDPAELEANPFRLFTSLLRLDLIEPEHLRSTAKGLLDQRSILTPDALRLIDLAELHGGLTESEAGAFVAALIETFRWHAAASVSAELYADLSARHRLIADVVGFHGPHINHLTPRVLDIDRAQARMIAAGFDPKAVIEGPPRRACPVLLRQTSFKALAEPIRFPSDDGTTAPGVHIARFGEIEQRGIALTPLGRARYDAWIAEGGDLSAALPDDWEALRREALAYFRYRREDGEIAAEPILYEDFLPVSAAGIFRSNLGAAGDGGASAASSGDRGALERAIGRPLHDECALYERESRVSLAACQIQTGD